MKKKFTKLWRSGIALLLVMSLVVGNGGVALAADDPVNSGSGSAEVEMGKNYVSLGDSMTNGYGLDGYEYEYHKGDNTMTECTDTSCEEEHVVFHWSNGYLQEAPDSYPVQIAKYFGWNLTQMGMSALRVEDLHWLLEVDPNTDFSKFESGRSYGSWKDDNLNGTWEEYLESKVGYREDLWNATFSSGDYFTWNEFTNGRLDQVYPGSTTASVVKEYQDAVANADVISIGIGNGNFGVFMLGRIMEAIAFDGTPDEAMIYKLENAIRECDPELQAEILALRETVYTALEAELATVGMSLNDGGMMEALINTVVYATVSYSLNYAGALEAIMKLNPDSEIILVGIMNTLAGMDMSYTDENGVETIIPMADVLGVIVEPVNTYIAALPTIMQALGNETYANATFYYAEAPEVECMVDTYEDALAAGNTTVRDRFITEIVGACDHSTPCDDLAKCDDWDTGMVWSMVGDMFNNMVADYGLKLVRINRADVEAYEEGSLEDADKVLSCAVYCAFETAIVGASHDAKISVNSFTALTDLSNVFAGVAKQLENLPKNVLDAVTKAGTAEVKSWINSWLQVDGNNAVLNTQIAAYMQTYPGATQEEAATDVSMVIFMQGNNLADENALTEYFADRYMVGCLAKEIGNTLPIALTSDATLMGLLHLFGRMLIGDGLGAHPSAAGHDELTEAIIKSYENKYTAKNETINNAIAVLNILADLAAEYYDEAYAYAYAEAKNAGYIDATLAAIDEVIATLTSTDLSDSQMTDAFKAEVAGEIEEIIETLVAAKALIVEADLLDQASLDALIVMLDEAGEAVANLLNLLNQAGVDVTELVIIPALEEAKAKLENEVIPAVKAALEELAADVYAYLAEAIPEACEQLAELIAEAAKEYLPEVADAIYDYLYNNPEEVIAFVSEYGPYVVEALEEYGDEVLAVLGYVLYNYGDEIAAFVIENHETILAAMVEWAEVHGENTIALIQVYAEALGLCDAVREQIAELEAALEELEAEIEAKIAELEAELEALKAELEAAADELKAEIEAKIAEVEAEIEVLKAEIAAKVEAVEAAIEELKAAVEQAISEGLTDLEVVKDAAEKLADEVADLIAAAKDTAIDAVKDAIAEVKAATEALDEALSNLLGDIYDDLKDLTSDALNAVIDAIADAVKEYAPEIADAIYEYLYNNPDEVIDFVKTYGSALLDILEEYGDEALAAIGYLLYTYGEDIAGLIVDNADEILEGLMDWLEVHGENAAALLQVYAEALGLCDAVREQIAELEALVEELKAQLENASEELMAEIEEKIAEVEAAIEELKDQLEELKAEIENAIIDAINKAEAAVDAVVEEIKATIEEIKAAVEEIKAEIEAVADAAADAIFAEIDEAIAQIEALVDEIIAAWEAAVEEATHGDYVVDRESYYVALGDGSALSESYVDLLAAELGLSERYENLAQEGLTVEDALNNLAAYAESLAKADLVTVGFNNNTLVNYMVDQMFNYMMGDAVDTPDWTVFVGEEGIPYVEKALANIYAELVAQGLNIDLMGVNLADALMVAIENYAYAYVEQVASYPALINAIHEISPDALVVLVGMYNSLNGVVVEVEGNEIELGQYVQSLVDLANLESLLYAIIVDDTVYVDAPEVEASATVAGANKINLVKFILGGEAVRDELFAALNPSADGHEYIDEQIMNALDVTYDVLLGDADSDGDVDMYDASLVLQYYAGSVDANALDMYASDVDGDGDIDMYDASLILQYYAGSITEFPAAE